MSNVSTTTLMKRDLEFVMNKNLECSEILLALPADVLVRPWRFLNLFKQSVCSSSARSSSAKCENFKHVSRFQRHTSFSRIPIHISQYISYSLGDKTTRIRIQVQRIMKPIRKYETSVQDVFVDHVWHCALRPLVRSVLCIVSQTHIKSTNSYVYVLRKQSNHTGTI